MMKKQLSSEEMVALDARAIDQVVGGSLALPLDQFPLGIRVVFTLPGEFDPRFGIPLPDPRPPILFVP